MERHLRAKDICHARDISPNTFYRLVKKGVIPPGERVGARAVRWRESVIEAAFAKLNEQRAA